ncbi:MAG: OB-fold nucleic acid binding domain-containing protein [Candidatus Nanohaloarchaeota archaeon QJJ-9]|nr:OB-fold nucleic acid binding domain-containing protein [Candidatus Nanohaloarchaeota archaeon QJJ-9]
MKISYRIAFLLILLGLLTAYTGELIYKKPKIAPEDIGKDQIGNKIVTKGTLKKVRYSGNTTFIHLHENSDLVIVKFTKENELEKGDKIRVSGEIDSYHGKVEIVAESIDPI